MRVLLRREEGREYLERLLERELASAALSAPDRGLLQELACGVVRWQAALDWLIDRKTDGRPQKPGLRVLLRLGLYQLFWLDRVPEHAAVFETVELGKQLGFGSQAGFLNALLRGYARERAETRGLLAALKESAPATGHSHSLWLVERWQARWGAEKAARLLEWDNSPPPTYVRVNTLRAEAGTLLQQWREKEGVEYDFFRRDWTGEHLVFELKSHPSLASMPSFREGAFYVQDPSTLLAVHVLDPQPGETILDACAAPGGKTTFIAQRMGNRGRVVALDPVPERLKMIRENCARLGVTCAEAGLPPSGPQTEAQYDRILVDAPCSNTGVMRRRVDLRWRIRPEEVARLHAAQAGLLRSVAPQLRPGGVLVYSTCSLEPEENGETVKRFLAENAGFTLEHERQLTPFEDGVDGAYVARFVKG